MPHATTPIEEAHRADTLALEQYLVSETLRRIARVELAEAKTHARIKAIHDMVDREIAGGRATLGGSIRAMYDAWERKDQQLTDANSTQAWLTHRATMYATAALVIQNVLNGQPGKMTRI